MEKEFVPYELAVKLKELGFTELCMYAWCEMGGFNRYTQERIDIYYALKTNGNPFGLFSEGHNWNRTIEGSNKNKIQCSAPLWQQAFDWFREKHEYDLFIKPMSFVGFNQYYDIELQHPKYCWDKPPKVTGKTYPEARQACLEKLIELVEDDRNINNVGINNPTEC